MRQVDAENADYQEGQEGEEDSESSKEEDENIVEVGTIIAQARALRLESSCP